MSALLKCLANGSILPIWKGGKENHPFFTPKDISIGVPPIRANAKIPIAWLGEENAPLSIGPSISKADTYYWVNVLRDYGYVDARGMGIRNKVIPSMRAHNDTEPDFVEEENRFIVRLWKGPKRQ